MGSGYSPDDFLYHAIECNWSLDSSMNIIMLSVVFQLIKLHTKQVP